MNDIFTSIYKSPIGKMKIVANEKALLRIDYDFLEPCNDGSENQIILNAITQLEEYFAKKRKIFDLPICKENLEKSDFFYKVQEQLIKIPFGKTLTYKMIANNIKNPNAYRAVGSACNKNPVSIVIPCHRVIGANGKLTGYAGGLNIKQKLLEHEASF